MTRHYDAENACKNAQLDRESTDLVINYLLTGLACSTGEATRNGIRDLVAKVDSLRIRVEEAVAEHEEEEEWNAGFEERQRLRDEREQ